MSEKSIQSLRGAIEDAVKRFSTNDQSFTDLAMLRINPQTFQVDIVEDPDPEVVDTDEAHDYIALMDLVDADPAAPGQWVADREAIDSLIADYE